MPRYKISGDSKATGRRRSRVYDAATLDDALNLAYADEIIVDLEAIEEVAAEPATERQIQAARNLKIPLPPNTTKDQAAVLINCVIEQQHQPTAKQLRYAKRLGIKHPDRFSREELSDEIDLALEDGDRDDGKPRCQMCGGGLKKKTAGRGVLTHVFISLLMIVVGVLLSLTGIGLIVGIPMILIGLFKGSKRQKLLVCRTCGAAVARA